ncbi:hypothetical protein [Effusibacillus dendaii]|uniref:Universal stress protein n=1 Tax=Effusibacillus dendaii TaxID=2743772 RepID=A0A7I8D841_9BACL|nr:hypothetical protein [Effusibacillus dendaii]BCJ85179.1 hypothetical protein skT53_01640 [Effusibacillus dendaii]
MLKRVRVAVDNSTGSDKAVEWGIKTFAELPETEYKIRFVYPSMIVAGEATFYTPSSIRAEHLDAKDLPS